MRTLTEYQKNFILEYFFENQKYPGWKHVATTLLESGQCIVPGNQCIWIGGIGNFIKTEQIFMMEINDGVERLRYKFDLEYFLTSEWYKEIRSQYILALAEEKKRIDKESADMVQEFFEIGSI